MSRHDFLHPLAKVFFRFLCFIEILGPGSLIFLENDLKFAFLQLKAVIVCLFIMSEESIWVLIAFHIRSDFLLYSAETLMYSL